MDDNTRNDSERFERIHSWWESDNRKENTHEYLLRTLEGQQLTTYKAKSDIIITEIEIIDYFNQSEAAIQLFEPEYPLVDFAPIPEQIGSPEYIKKYGYRNIKKDITKQIVTKHRPSDPYTGNECFFRLAYADLEWLQIQIRASKTTHEIKDLEMRNIYLIPFQISEVEEKEMIALFEQMFEQAKMIGFKTSERFASHEAQTCETIWHSIPKRFLVAEQWIDFLKKVGQGKVLISPSEIPVKQFGSITFRNSKHKEEIISELSTFIPLNANLLNDAFDGKLKGERLFITCKQNEFAEVFKRLKYNDLITQTDGQIIDWLLDNFERVDSKGQKSLGRRSIEDLFKPSGKPPKDILCDFNWLKFKSADLLTREAFEKSKTY